MIEKSISLHLDGVVRVKTFRITWYAVVEDGSVLEGRSLISAETQEDAINELISKKANEYRLKPYMVRIQSIFELENDLSTKLST